MRSLPSKALSFKDNQSLNSHGCKSLPRNEALLLACVHSVKSALSQVCLSHSDALNTQSPWRSCHSVSSKKKNHFLHHISHRFSKWIDIPGVTRHHKVKVWHKVIYSCTLSQLLPTRDRSCQKRTFNLLAYSKILWLVSAKNSLYYSPVQAQKHRLYNITGKANISDHTNNQRALKTCNECGSTAWCCQPMNSDFFIQVLNHLGSLSQAQEQIHTFWNESTGSEEIHNGIANISVLIE